MKLTSVMERAAVCVLMVAPLYGCSGPSGTRPPAASSSPGHQQPAAGASKAKKRREQEAMLHQVAAELFAHKIRKNGAYILCDQAAYRRCFRVNKQRCLAELRSYNEQCFTKGLAHLHGYVNAQNVRKFGHVYSACLLSKHLADHVDHYTYTASCLRRTKLSRRRALKSLLR